MQSGAKPVEKSKPKLKPKKKYLQLPESSDSWRVYPLNKAPVKGNEKGFLNPKKFGGLEYEVLGNPQKDVYTIKTKDYGKVNIYTAKSTGFCGVSSLGSSFTSSFGFSSFGSFEVSVLLHAPKKNNEANNKNSTFFI